SCPLAPTCAFWTAEHGLSRAARNPARRNCGKQADANPYSSNTLRRKTLRAAAGHFATPMRFHRGRRLNDGIMLNSLKNFISELTGGSKHPARFEENDYRLAAAALLIHAAAIDGKETGAEHEKLRAVLKSRFALDDAATDELIDVGTLAENEAVDLYHFTRLI